MAWEVGKPVGVSGSILPRIAVLCPYRNSMDALFVESVWGPLRWVPLDWCAKMPRSGDGVSLPMVRNRLAEVALKEGATHLLWVDSDAVMENPPDPNLALRWLYDRDVPIVSGLYVAKQVGGFNYGAWGKAVDQTGKQGYTPIQSWTGNWFTVAVTGLHFCLIKREVFEAVQRPWFHWEEDGQPSEDFYFFEKAAAKGYQVRIFTEVRLSHLGSLKVRSDKTITTRAT